MENVVIKTRCRYCKNFLYEGDIEIKIYPYPISFGICNEWCHHVNGDEFCSRGEYDEDWMRNVPLKMRKTAEDRTVDISEKGKRGN